MVYSRFTPGLLKVYYWNIINNSWLASPFLLDFSAKVSRTSLVGPNFCICCTILHHILSQAPLRLSWVACGANPYEPHSSLYPSTFVRPAILTSLYTYVSLNWLRMLAFTLAIIPEHYIYEIRPEFSNGPTDICVNSTTGSLYGSSFLQRRQFLKLTKVFVRCSARYSDLPFMYLCTSHLKELDVYSFSRKPGNWKGDNSKKITLLSTVRQKGLSAIENALPWMIV